MLGGAIGKPWLIHADSTVFASCVLSGALMLVAHVDCVPVAPWQDVEVEDVEDQTLVVVSKAVAVVAEVYRLQLQHH
jgi:hypothetical protein